MKNIEDADLDRVARNLNKSQTTPDDFIEEVDLDKKSKKRLEEILEGKD